MPALDALSAPADCAERQPLGGDRRPCDVARQMLEHCEIRVLDVAFDQSRALERAPDPFGDPIAPHVTTRAMLALSRGFAPEPHRSGIGPYAEQVVVNTR
jgi:hypothetical protein